MQGQLFYSMQGQQYYESQQVAVPDDCNGATFINKGDGDVTVNGVPLVTSGTAGVGGESFSIGGNLGEIFAGRCTVAFAPGQAAPQLLIIWKFYVNPNQA